MRFDMEDTSTFDMADTFVLEDTSVKPAESIAITGILGDLDDEDMADTYVLDDDAISNAEKQGMTGILKDLDDEEINELESTEPASAASSGYTIELSLDDDDY